MKRAGVVLAVAIVVGLLSGMSGESLIRIAVGSAIHSVVSKYVWTGFKGGKDRLYSGRHSGNERTRVSRHHLEAAPL